MSQKIFKKEPWEYLFGFLDYFLNLNAREFIRKESEDLVPYIF